VEAVHAAAVSTSKPTCLGILLANTQFLWANISLLRHEKSRFTNLSHSIECIKKNQPKTPFVPYNILETVISRKIIESNQLEKHSKRLRYKKN
jgi:hypothetical protein